MSAINEDAAWGNVSILIVLDVPSTSRERSTKLIPLTHNKAAMVDDADYPLLVQWKWQYCPGRNNSTGYAIRTDRSNGKHTVRMHVYLMAARGVDHEDGNGLNNQRSNLRIAGLAENGWNRKLNDNSTSGFKGVHWRADRGLWQARISTNGVRRSLGFFETKEAAGEAYDLAAMKYHGEFARLNSMDQK